MKSLPIRKGDRVKVIAGKDRGTVGEVIGVNPEKGTVTVQGVRVVKKHRPNQPNAAGKVTGGIITTEAPIHVSNVQLVVKTDKGEEVTRIGYERKEVTKKRPDGSEYTTTRSVRIAKKTGKEI